MYAQLIDRLERHDVPLRVPRHGAVVWDDEAAHAAAYAADPTGYALLGLLPGVLPRQRARVLLRVLDSSWAGHPEHARATLRRVVAVLQAGLPAADVATVLLALRRRRANHRHVTRSALRLLTDHPEADALVRSHRAVLVDCLEHALGQRTARGLARRTGADDDRPLQRRLRQLYAGAERPDLGRGPVLDLAGAGDRPATVTVTNRGEPAATLVRLACGGDPGSLRDGVERSVRALAADLPPYPGTVGLVLDRSESMRGYGDREWAQASQAEALRLVLQRCCARLVVVPVGGEGTRPGEAGTRPGDAPATPGGPTDLATGLLDALDRDPAVVAVVSDGYENVYPGDLARVIASLPGAGVRTPVAFCQSTFGHSDDLALRRPAPAAPQRAFWHATDLVPLVIWLVAHVADGAATDVTDATAARDWLHAALLRRLDAVERQLSPRPVPDDPKEVTA